MAGSGVMNERIDWRFKTVPQPAVNNRVILQPRYVSPIMSALPCVHDVLG